FKTLDDLPGRRVDNADFFALDDYKKVPDSELYERLLTEFPGWLKAAAAAGILR
ncbi:MAG: VWA domain-containing protein, partial [Ruminococcus sp.]|nr:VWA domain-containing protein [Ruminococcus sp.]